MSYIKKTFQCEHCQEYFQNEKLGRGNWPVRGAFCSKECLDACTGGHSIKYPDKVCGCGRKTYNYFKCSECLGERVSIDDELMMGV